MHAALSMRRFSLPGIHEPMRNDKVLDVWRKDSDTSQLVDGEIRCRDTSEAPDKSSGSPVVVLIGAAVMSDLIKSWMCGEKIRIPANWLMAKYAVGTPQKRQTSPVEAR